MNNDDLLADRASVFSSVCSEFAKEGISRLFGESSRLFQNFRMEFEIEHQPIDSLQFDRSTSPMLRHGSMTLTGSFDGSTYSVHLGGDIDYEDFLSSSYEVFSGIYEFYIDFLLGDYSERFVSPIAFVSERSFIHLFYKDLDFTKNQAMVELRRIRAEQSKQDQRWREVIDRMSLTCPRRLYHSLC